MSQQILNLYSGAPQKGFGLPLEGQSPGLFFYILHYEIETTEKFL